MWNLRVQIEKIEPHGQGLAGACSPLQQLFYVAAGLSQDADSEILGRLALVAGPYSEYGFDQYALMLQNRSVAILSSAVHFDQWAQVARRCRFRVELRSLAAVFVL